MKGISLRKVILSELTILQKICVELYSLHFSTYWENDGLKLYLEEQFSSERLNSDLKNKSINFFFIMSHKQIIGFLKVNLNADIELFNQKNNSELEKIYIHPTHQKNGIGQFAMKSIIKKIQQEKKASLFLDVLDNNQKAILFYKNLGFKLHEKIKLSYVNFKEELNSISRMVLKL